MLANTNETVEISVGCTNSSGLAGCYRCHLAGWQNYCSDSGETKVVLTGITTLGDFTLNDQRWRGSSNAANTAGEEGEGIGYFVTGTAALSKVSDINVSTQAGAGLAISVADAALDTVAKMRAGLGAIDNRLAYTMDNLINVSEKTEAARSRIEDADFALESAKLAKAQVLQQAGTSMLAQANQMTQLVLDLIR